MNDDKERDLLERRYAPFPWDNVMAFGFSVLKLSSQDFWAMTPREVASAMHAFAPSGPSSIKHSDFLNLMQQFPDDKENNDN